MLLLLLLLGASGGGAGGGGFGGDGDDWRGPVSMLGVWVTPPGQHAVTTACGSAAWDFLCSHDSTTAHVHTAIDKEKICKEEKSKTR
jgi:hypothetical protein